MVTARSKLLNYPAIKNKTMFRHLETASRIAKEDAILIGTRHERYDKLKHALPPLPPKKPERAKLVLPIKNGDLKKLIDEYIEELHKAQTKETPVVKNLNYWIDKSLDAMSTSAAMIAQTAALVVYVGLNTLAVTKVIQFDPYPFLFLNTVFSIISGFTTVIVLNSNARQDVAANKARQLSIKGVELTLKLLETVASKTKGDNHD